MFLRKHDIVEITKGEDFDGNSLVGKKALVKNIITPESKDAQIFVDGMEHDIFFPKDWMKLIERPLAAKLPSQLRTSTHLRSPRY
jgi:hypothetical protein